MNASEIVIRAKASGIHLWVDGPRLKYQGPTAAVDEIRPVLAAHKSEIVDYLQRVANEAADLARYPVADGPYTPYAVPMSLERVAGLLADLRATIGSVADIEGWTDERRAHLLGLVARHPISTLADDLAYFRERLSAIEAVARAAETGRQAAAKHDAIHKCSTCQHMTHHDYGVPVRCQMGKAQGWRHHESLDAPDILNTCKHHHPKRG